MCVELLHLQSCARKSPPVQSCVWNHLLPSHVRRSLPPQSCALKSPQSCVRKSPQSCVRKSPPVMCTELS